MDWYRLKAGRSLQMLPVDHEVVQLASVSYYGPSSDMMGQIINLLVGHPNVYLDSTSATVQRGELGLLLEQDKKNWKIVPSINGRSVQDFDHVSFGDSEWGIAISLLSGEIIVARASQELWNMAREFVLDIPIVPPKAQPDFLKRIPLLEAKLPVGLPESMKGEFVPAEKRLVLKMSPTATIGPRFKSWHNLLRVEPITIPGEGPIEVPGHIDQVRVQAKRDLDDERFRAGTLAKELFLHRFPSTGSNCWTLATDDDVLDLLDTARARPEDDPKIIWPQDAGTRTMQMLGEIAPSSLKVEVKDQRDWFGLSGSITIGGQQIPLSDLLAALKGDGDTSIWVRDNSPRFRKNFVIDWLVSLT